MAQGEQQPVLRVRDLRTEIHTEEGVLTVVDNVSFDVGKGEIFGLVGESGCGKSMTSLSIMGLLPRPQGRIAQGQIMFGGEDLVTLPRKELKRLSGNRLAMIFQEPMTSLNPVYPVGDQIAEPLRIHKKMTRRQAHSAAIELLARVGIAEPQRRVDDYPHQMSGGMQQRVMIAIALSCEPDLLIADEPTTALDVTIQAQILDLILGLRDEVGMSVIMITHDLGVIAEVADRMAIMYAGTIVETGDAVSVFDTPGHPYNLGLMRSVPRIEATHDRLVAIPGTVVAPDKRGSGCRFENRCTFADGQCRLSEPELRPTPDGHLTRCFHSDAVLSEARNRA